MSIDDFLKTVDQPKSPISYPMRPLYESSNGDKVLGLDPHVQELVRCGQPLVPPLQVVRRPGLGDKVFALSAVNTLLQEQPDLDVTFSGLDTDDWLKLIPWVKTGLNLDCNTVANLDNTPPNGGDRVKLMGEILGVDVTSIRFKINKPKSSIGLKKPYYVFSPFAAMQGPRSIPLNTILSVVQNPPIPLAITDRMAYDFPMSCKCYNATGMDMFQLISLIMESSGMIAADTGTAWLAAACGIPTAVLFSHIRSPERTMTCDSVWGIDSPAPCASTCGDHIGTRPECRWRDNVPACVAHMTPEFVRHCMREFEVLVR